MWPYIEHRPSTWTAQLPLAECAANNAVNVLTRFTPFYLNLGQYPVTTTMLLAHGQPKSLNEAVKEALEHMKIALGGRTNQPLEGPRENEMGSGQMEAVLNV